MKLLFSTIVTIALIITTDKPVAVEEPTSSTVAYFRPAAEASFGYANPFYLDIDKDGKSDFSFQTVSFSQDGQVYTQYLVNPMNDNQVMHVEGSAAIAEAGELISEDLPRGNVHWSDAHAEIIESRYTGESMDWFGTWSGGRDQYLGIKLVKEGKSYLGWVRVEVNPETEMAYVKEYAINRQAGAQVAVDR